MTANINSITITKPDDWHLHLRDGAMLATVLPFSENVFARGLIMPNLKPPVANKVLAENYFNKIMAVRKNNFQPKMAIYLTAQTTADTVNECINHQNIIAFKWYPMGATTNSDFGVSEQLMLNNPQLQEVLSALSQSHIPLCIHAEVVDNNIDIFAREKVFIERVLIPLLKIHPKLKIVFEHLSTAAAVNFINENSAKYTLGGTITAHHLSFNRNIMLAGGIRPHYYCLPILKKESDRLALIKAAISGSPNFFLGTDSAPHTRNNKENSCGCAGCFSAPVAMSLYAEVFNNAGAISKLENFASKFGAEFYQLPLNQDKVELVKTPSIVPQSLGSGENTIVPFLAGETLTWQVII